MREVQQTECDLEMRMRCFVGAIIGVIGILMGIWMFSKPGGAFVGLVFFYFSVPGLIMMMKVVITGKDFKCMDRY